MSLDPCPLNGLPPDPSVGPLSTHSPYTPTRVTDGDTKRQRLDLRSSLLGYEHCSSASYHWDAFRLRLAMGRRATVRSAYCMYSHALMVLLSAPTVGRHPSASPTPQPDDPCYKRGDAWSIWIRSTGPRATAAFVPEVMHAAEHLSCVNMKGSGWNHCMTLPLHHVCIGESTTIAFSHPPTH